MRGARLVCKPRNGEKAMKTPIEKASAVRSGGSSIASRRRKAARNMWFQVFDSSCRVNTVPGSKSETRKPNLFKTLQGFCFVVVGVKHREQFRNHEEILNS